MVTVNDSTLEQRPLGGMETALIRLTQALSRLGHHVVVFTNQENPPLSYPLYLPYKSINMLGEIDALVAVRDWKPIFLPVQSKKYYFWTGDSYDLPQTNGIGDLRIVEKLTALLGVSNWHTAKLCEESGFPIEKGKVLRNGVHLPYFKANQNRIKKRLIYSSTPFRGLKYLPAIFNSLKSKHPELELHIFSDFDVYRDKNSSIPQHIMQEFKHTKLEFSKIPGCFMHGNIKQEELAREMLRSSILVYPNTFQETSCITVMEAQAAGCVVITSELGALPETVGDAGVLVKGRPGSNEYLANFISELDYILSNQSLQEELSIRARNRANTYSWDTIAKEFEILINS